MATRNLTALDALEGKIMNIGGGYEIDFIIGVTDPDSAFSGTHLPKLETSCDYWDGEQWRDLYEPKRVQALDYRNCPNCSQMYPLEDFVGGCPRCGAPYMVKDG